MGVTPGIGTLRESSLHAALKQLYARPGDDIEAARDGYVVDLVRPHELVEFQTGNFGSIGAKLRTLLATHRVRVVHPVAAETTIVRIDADGAIRSRRRSPLRGCPHSLFDELVAIPLVACHPRLTFEVVLVRVDEHRVDAPRTRRRRKPWRVADRVLVEVLERQTFGGDAGLAGVLPRGLAEPFTTLDVAHGLGVPRALAQRIAYTLRTAGLIEIDGRTAGGIGYRTASRSSSAANPG